MRRNMRFAITLLVIFTTGALYAGEVIDRIVATVGKRAILQSELDETVRFEMFSAGRQLASVGDQDVKSALNRIIDQQLIRSDIGPSEAFAPSGEDVNKAIAEIRAQIAGAVDEKVWSSVLQQYGISEDIVRDRVRNQLETVRIVNSRLRPGVRIDQAEVEEAYRQEFLPKLKQAGAKEVPLSEVSQRIRQLLVERRIGEALDKWVEVLRSQGEVHILAAELRAQENSNAGK